MAWLKRWWPWLLGYVAVYLAGQTLLILTRGH